MDVAPGIERFIDIGYHLANGRPDLIIAYCKLSLITIVAILPKMSFDNRKIWHNQGRDVRPALTKDNRLINYQDLFNDWEDVLKFQIGGKDDKNEG